MLKLPLSIGLTRPMILGLLGLYLLGSVFEGIGLTILLPVFQLIQSGETAAALAEKSRWWGYLVDAYSFVGITITVPVLLITSFVAILFRQATVYLRMINSAYVKFAVIRGIRDRAFHAFLNARLGYGEKEGMGKIVNDLTTEAVVAVEAAMTVITIVSMMMLAIVYLFILFMLSVPMTLSAIVIMTIAVLPVIHFVKRGREIGQLFVKANGALLVFLTERLKSARLIRLSGMEHAEYQNMRAHTAEQYKRVMEGNILRARTSVVIEPVAVAAGFAFLYFGVSRFGLPLEAVGLFLVIVLRLVPVVKELANLHYTLSNRIGSVSRVLDRLKDLEAARETDSGELDTVRLERCIRFKDVSFSYEDVRDFALKGINLEIQPRKITALVGPSGSGKSTLIDMLPRLRVPTSGEIFFDDKPASEFALTALRQSISYAPQNPQIFNVTAREHIQYGQPEANQAAIERAAKLAGAHDYITRLDNGYDTILSEAGARLSGGQRQRLDLARALLKPAKILILDEPTSQLDAESEASFREALERIKSETDLTVIIVGHRFATISVADQIVVLQGGRVSESGTHAKLMKKGRWYAKAYRQQHQAGGTGIVEVHQST